MWPNLTFTSCANRKSKFNMISINEDINYRHSRTPSVCQYKHQSLVIIVIIIIIKNQK